MFNSKISTFQTFDSAPVSIELTRWIRSTMNANCDFARQVLQYRETAKDELKKSLPLATVGAICEGGRKLEDVATRTGWIALDVDAKDNPHLEDAEAVRDAIAKIVYVAFSGLSVSGKGVWALVKVANPQKQEKYFQKLQQDFLNRGIALDSTKGKNPNDARFYSYDPDAYIADEFDVYDRLPQNKKVREKFHKANNSLSLNDSDKYGAAAFEDELDTLSRTGNGNRNNQLFKSSASLAQLVAGGVLNKSDVADALFDTARSIGLKDYEIKTTINSGFNAGMKEPRKPAKNRRTKPLRKKDRRSNGTCETKKIKQYPDSWDNVKEPEKGSQEYEEATRGMINDANEKELQELCRRDSTVAALVEIFDAEPIEEIELIS